MPVDEGRLFVILPYRDEAFREEKEQGIKYRLVFAGKDTEFEDIIVVIPDTI